MKRLLLIVLPLLLIVGCSKPINDETLIEEDGLMYHPETKELYSGDVFKNYLGGKTEYEGSYKNGKQDGLFTYWHENGKKKWEGSVNDGKPDGLLISWYESGQKWTIGTYKDGKKDGKWTYWHENGQKYSEGIYKVGNVISEKCWDEVGNEKDCINTY